MVLLVQADYSDGDGSEPGDRTEIRTKREESKMALRVNMEVTGKMILQYKSRSRGHNTDV